MHSISNLRQTLGLTSANQVRNRIEAIKDLLLSHIRRGPNNQILLTDAGVELLRRLQELYDSGLTMAEASEILRATLYKKDHPRDIVSSGSAVNGMKHDQTAAQLVALRNELTILQRRVAILEQRFTLPPDPHRDPASWWSALREEIDAP